MVNSFYSFYSFCIMADEYKQADIEQLAKGIIDDDGNYAGGWLDTFLDLRSAGLHWKKAAYVAWYNAPKATRQPSSTKELAKMLNYKTDQTLYKWQHKPWFTEVIDKARQAIFTKYLADVDRKTIGAALDENGAPGVAARKLFYEMAGRYTAKQEITHSGSVDVTQLSDAELQSIIED